MVTSYSHFRSGTNSGFSRSFAILPNFLKSGIFSTVSFTGFVFLSHVMLYLASFGISQEYLGFTQHFNNPIPTLVLAFKGFSCVISHCNQIFWLEDQRDQRFILFAASSCHLYVLSCQLVGILLCCQIQFASTFT